jgi:hypothetical protein
MKSLLHSRVIRVWYLKHRVKFKTSCILSLDYELSARQPAGDSLQEWEISYTVGGSPNAFFSVLDE